MTRDAPGFPLGCRPAAAAALVQKFFTAINQANPRYLGSVIASEPDFQWYSVNEGGRNFVAYDRGQALEYLLGRHEHRERLRLLMLDVAFDEARDLGHISYVIRRSADDLEPDLGGPNHIAIGKGAFDCTDRTIIVWSMGMDRVGKEGEVEVNWPCPTPAGWQPGSEVIACARGS